MKNLILTLFLMFMINGCGGTGSSENGKVTKIMPLGDSITYDDRHGDSRPASERTAYRDYLYFMLKDAGVKFNFVGSKKAGEDYFPDPENEGYPGWSSYQISGIIYDKLVKNSADIILLHIGTNDRNHGDISGVNHILDEIDRYEKDYGKTITVLVALIIQRQKYDTLINTFNSHLEVLLDERISQRDKLRIVDMSNILEYNDYYEKTHPNNRGYKKIAQKWFEELIAILH